LELKAYQIEDKLKLIYLILDIFIIINKLIKKTMKRIVKLTESDLSKLVKRIIKESYDIDEVITELDDWIEGNVDHISRYSLEDKVKELLNMDEEITSEVEELESDEGDEYGENWGTKIIVIKYNDEDLMKVCVTSEGGYHFGKNNIVFEGEPRDKLVRAGFGIRFYFDKSLL